MTELDISKILSPIELDEIIDIFKNYILEKSVEKKSGYIKFIDFKYPIYFIENFGINAITDKIYNYIIIHTKRRCYDKIIDISYFLQNKIKYDIKTEELTNNIIFYDYNNKSCNNNDTNIIGCIIPIMNRDFCKKNLDKNYNNILNNNIKKETKEIIEYYKWTTPENSNIHVIYNVLIDNPKIKHGKYSIYSISGCLITEQEFDNGNMISEKFF